MPPVSRRGRAWSNGPPAGNCCHAGAPQSCSAAPTGRSHRSTHSVGTRRAYCQRYRSELLFCKARRAGAHDAPRRPPIVSSMHNRSLTSGVEAPTTGASLSLMSPNVPTAHTRPGQGAAAVAAGVFPSSQSSPHPHRHRRSLPGWRLRDSSCPRRACRPAPQLVGSSTKETATVKLPRSYPVPRRSGTGHRRQSFRRCPRVPFVPVRQMTEKGGSSGSKLPSPRPGRIPRQTPRADHR